MTEHDNRQEILGSVVGNAIENLPGILRANGLDSLQLHEGALRMNVTLCPLYAQGELQASQLLDSPTAVAESRVAGKWQTAISTAQAVHQSLQSIGVNVHVVFTFADLGVIVDQSNDRLVDLLLQHRRQYEAAAEMELFKTGVSFAFQSYSDLGVDFPQFVQPSTESQTERSRRDVVDGLVRDISDRVRFDETMMTRYNKKVRPTVTSMVNAFGYDLARLFLEQYGTFDGVTSRPGDLNCYLERGELLLNLTSLFSHGNDALRSRVDIKV